MTSPNNADSKRMKAPKSGVSVRMYNPGFGDCFLLAFRAKDGTPRYMLIDCGVHHQYLDQEERIAHMQRLVTDIGEATDHHLHIVAITHEHTDHLYGFKYARGAFDAIQIDELWLAWTEDPTDLAAQALKELYGMQMKALNAAVDQLENLGSPLAAFMRGLPDYEPRQSLVDTGGNADQLAYLRAKSVKKLVRPEDYRQPGEVLPLWPEVEQVRAYVLGPPKEVKWIRSLVRKNELYPEMAVMDATYAFYMGAKMAFDPQSLSEDEQRLVELSLPFDPVYRIERKDVEGPVEKEGEGPKDPIQAFFHAYYGFTEAEGEGQAWRRIEADWLAWGEQLALSIDQKTNNTSLSLAIEVGDEAPRKVLLFVGDAQVGNWLSWQELAWPGEGEGDPELKVPDLLARTVLYKVGHHGSHNATLKQKGLEMMVSPDLVAMIPVDSDWANEVMNWEHPAEHLYEALVEQTQGRVLRTDQIPSGNRLVNRHRLASTAEWRAFRRNVDWDRSEDRLWIQYDVR